MKPPVFVLGCPRSGTTLLYHMLLSAGGFAVYSTETQFFDMIMPRFGNLKSSGSREALLEQWLASHYFERSGLDREYIKNRLMSECRAGADFLKIVMESIAESQNVDRWAETTPAHLLYIPEIKKAFPDALILHVIRDGRDCALSLDKQRWIAPLPFDRKHRLATAGMYWEWIVRKGRKYGRMIAPDYMEVRFEELTANPAETLSRIGSFINHDLDYARIQRVAIGSVSKPNTSFDDGADIQFSPVGRWREKFPEAELAVFESTVGTLLKELGYELAISNSNLSGRIGAMARHSAYKLFFDTKQWIKSRTPLSRFMVDTGLLRQGPQYLRGRERIALLSKAITQNSSEEINNQKLEEMKS